jgi:hypothetical protein
MLIRLSLWIPFTDCINRVGLVRLESLQYATPSTEFHSSRQNSFQILPPVDYVLDISTSRNWSLKLSLSCKIINFQSPNWLKHLKQNMNCNFFWKTFRLAKKKISNDNSDAVSSCSICWWLTVPPTGERHPAACLSCHPISVKAWARPTWLFTCVFGYHLMQHKSRHIRLRCGIWRKFQEGSFFITLKPFELCHLFHFSPKFCVKNDVSPHDQFRDEFVITFFRPTCSERHRVMHRGFHELSSLTPRQRAGAKDEKRRQKCVKFSQKWFSAVRDLKTPLIISFAGAYSLQNHLDYKNHSSTGRWRERGNILILREMFRNWVQEREVEIISHISELSNLN